MTIKVFQAVCQMTRKTRWYYTLEDGGRWVAGTQPMRDYGEASQATAQRLAEAVLSTLSGVAGENA